MRRAPDIARFAAGFLALSVVLGWVFWSAEGSVGAYRLDASMLAVPVVSAMLASVGFSWQRKLTYSAVTIAVYVLSGVVAEITGLNGLAAEQLSVTGSFPSLPVILLMAWLATFPIAMLVLFVGRTPAKLWESATGR